MCEGRRDIGNHCLPLSFVWILNYSKGQEGSYNKSERQEPGVLLAAVGATGALRLLGEHYWEPLEAFK